MFYLEFIRLIAYFCHVMNKMSRQLIANVRRRWETSPKAIIIYGPRQVGKTTLIKSILEPDAKALYINADLRDYHDVLSSRDLRALRMLLDGYDYLLLDEAQRINNIGLTLKIIVDNIPDIKVIATGSSSLDLSSAIVEHMTGRYWEYQMYPISMRELADHTSTYDADRRLEELLVYGCYPEVFHYDSRRDKIDYLKNLTNSYLYKDILELSGIRNSKKLQDLLRLLSYQVGQLVSHNELGRNLNLSTETVQHYIDLLVKSFVLKPLHPYHDNQRKAITKMNKYYFVDLGVRNAVIDDYKPLHLRNDKGPLWENFLFIERQKYNEYNYPVENYFFWRLYSGAEIDYLEEQDGQLRGYEYKWKAKRSKSGKSWQNAYPEASYEQIDRDNYLDYIGFDLS